MASGTKASPTITAAPPVTLFWADQILTRNRLNTTDVGPIEFNLKFANAIAAGGTFTVLMSSTNFVPRFDSLVWCYFDFDLQYDNKVPSELCTDNGAGLITVRTPYNMAIPANTWFRLAITTLNDPVGINGYTMPAAYGWYTFTITSGSEQSVRRQWLPDKSTYFQIFESTNYVTNNGMTGFMKLAFRPRNGIPASATFEVYFPVRSQENEDLFDEDLGYGLPSGSSVPCNTREGWTATSNPTFPTYTVNCILTHGSKATNTHAMITMTGAWGTLNTGKLYEFEIAGYKIPNVAADNRHVEIIVLVKNGGTLINNGVAYDFSVKNHAPLVAGAYAVVPTASTAVAGDTGVQYTFRFTAPAGLSLDANQPYDFFVVEFP